MSGLTTTATSQSVRLRRRYTTSSCGLAQCNAVGRHLLRRSCKIPSSCGSVCARPVSHPGNVQQEGKRTQKLKLGPNDDRGNAVTGKLVTSWGHQGDELGAGPPQLAGRLQKFLVFLPDCNLRWAGKVAAAFGPTLLHGAQRSGDQDHCLCSFFLFFFFNLLFKSEFAKSTFRCPLASLFEASLNCVAATIPACFRMTL